MSSDEKTIICITKIQKDIEAISATLKQGDRRMDKIEQRMMSDSKQLETHSKAILAEMREEYVEKKDISWMIKAKDRLAGIGLVVCAIGAIAFTYLSSRFMHH